MKHPTAAGSFGTKLAKLLKLFLHEFTVSLKYFTNVTNGSQSAGNKYSTGT